MIYGIEMTWQDLCEDEYAMKLVKNALPMFEKIAQMSPAASRISIRSATHYAPEAFPAEKVAELDAALKEYGKTKGLSEKDKEKIVKYKEIKEIRKKKRKSDNKMQKKNLQNAIYPGKVWLDTEGKRIQAHGGAVFYEDGVYYWYGENKEFTDGISDIWTWGIRVYKSTDLCNWEDLGLLIEPILDNPASNLFPDMNLDRPHIIKCDATGKYVAWIKVSGAQACFVILTADKFLGPYTVEKENYHPLGYDVGDFDIVKDEEQAYLYMDSEHTCVAGFELSVDYLSVERKISSQYENRIPPFNREGVTMFAYHGKKYMLTSGISGYTPNQSDLAIAEQWTDTFVSVGDPHIDDDTMSSFNSQVTQVFQVPDRPGLYIALADRWMPNHLVDGRMAESFRRCIASRYQPEQYHATEEEQEEFRSRPDLEAADTSVADYVWLPLCFEKDRVGIRWRDNWSPEEYEAGRI